MRVALLGVTFGFAVSTLMLGAAPAAAHTSFPEITTDSAGATAYAKVKKSYKKRRHAKRRARVKHPNAITLWEA